MRKINKNIFVFIIVLIIIGFGFISKPYAVAMIESVISFVSDTKAKGPAEAFSNLTDSVESNSTEKLSYHNTMMDINSAYNNLINTRIVEKEDETVVKMDNGYLSHIIEYATDSEIEGYVENIRNLKESTNKPLIYIMAPRKGNYSTFPSNAPNNIKSNCDRFINQLKNNSIDYLDLRVPMVEQGITEEEAFFVTDHHWKPTMGFWATNEICKKLNADYDFTYDKEKLDISNYNIKTYKDMMLGSYGRKVGTYFTNYGLDDFDVITPKFDTNLIHSDLIKNETRSGDFKEALLYPSHLDNSDVYNTEPYTTYMDSNNTIRVIKNLNADKDAKTILMVRDSYACVVTPFLSLNCKELHILDIRRNVRVESVSDYANEVNPDYILILYNGYTKKHYFDFR